MGDVGEWWARTFEPEGSGGYSGYGGEAERREETKTNIAMAPVIAKEKEDARIKAITDAADNKSKKQAQASAIQQRTSFGSNEKNLSRSFLLRL